MLNRSLEDRVRERTAEVHSREKELRAAMERLSRSESLLSRLMETSPTAIAVTDRTGQITFVNRQAELLLGIRREEIIQRRYNAPSWRIRSWDGRTFPDEELPFSRVKTTLQPVFGVRHAIEWPDGRLVLLSINAAPLRDATGQFDGMVATIEDGTESARAAKERTVIEEQLRHSQKMKAIGRLAAGLAHDFNNLLTVVLGYAEHLLDALPQGDPLREDVLEIREAGRRTAEITRQLLAFSRRQPMQVDNVNVGQLMERMRRMLGRLLGEDIELALELAQDLPCVRIDPVQLEQVIVNLAVNARDAMPSGGRLLIRAARATALPGEAGLGRLAGNTVCLTVADSGCGMPNERLDPGATAAQDNAESGNHLHIRLHRGGLSEHDAILPDIPFLQKPFDFNQLSGLLRRVLQPPAG